MGYLKLNANDPQYGDNHVDVFECPITLMKDFKPICRTRCLNPPFQMPSNCIISDIYRPKPGDLAPELAQCVLFPDAENTHQRAEWKRFMEYLKIHKKVARAKVGSCDFYISSPNEGSNFGHAIMLYQTGKKQEANEVQKHDFAATSIHQGRAAGASLTEATKLVRGANALFETSHPGTKVVNKGGNFTRRLDACLMSRIPAATNGKCSDEKSIEVIDDSDGHEVADKSSSRANAATVRQSGPLRNNLMQTHPSYLRTLGQSHSGWIFGAIAELVDNARDAKATKLEISVDVVFSKRSGEKIPMLSVIDDGHGMSHQDILRMLSFGHEQPDVDDPRRIGRYGIGFKTGAMRLGKDALVLSQTTTSRSIAFLSQSFNEGKDSLEIPIVSYQRQGRFMDVDTRVLTEALAKCNLEAIKEFSPFNEYLIGEKAGLFRENGTGTQIHMWNLDKWGSDFCLEWQNERRDGNSFHKGDILIRSRRIRTRPGQTSRTVPLDYSLQSYLEVMFLEPRMKIFVQGSQQVKCRPLAKSLSQTVIEDGIITGKPVQLIMGFSQLVWEQANCGIFLYWRGRLIEAYKRVGGMVHSADTGRGVIGVMDVTDIMDDGNGQALVLNNKQGFQDCELYAQLENWLGRKFDRYWDTNFDSLQVVKGTALDKPDNEWVQCDKCRKWRMLSSDFDSRQLPVEWFCYMDPFRGQCEKPEQTIAPGVITVSTKRGGSYVITKPFKCQDECPKESNGFLEGGNDGEDEAEEGQDVQPVWKRLRRSIPRSCKKT